MPGRGKCWPALFKILFCCFWRSQNTFRTVDPEGSIPYFRPGIMPFMERIIFIMPPPDSFFIIVCICSN